VSAELIGAPELHRRLKAIAAIGAPGHVGRTSLSSIWADTAANAARSRVPVRTGTTRQSIQPAIRRGERVVVGKYTVNFIDAGAKGHVEPRQPGLTPTGRVSRRKRGTGKILTFQVGGRTLFRKKVNKPAIAARPFKKWAAAEGLKLLNWKAFVYGVWNKAA